MINHTGVSSSAVRVASEKNIMINKNTKKPNTR